MNRNDAWPIPFFAVAMVLVAGVPLRAKADRPAPEAGASGEQGVEQDGREVVGRLRVAIATRGVPKSRQVFVRALTKTLAESVSTVLIDPLRKDRKTRPSGARARGRRGELVTGARQLGADYVLEVARKRAGRVFEVRAALIGVRSGEERVAWSIADAPKKTDPSELGGRIARTTVRMLKRISEDEPRRTGAGLASEMNPGEIPGDQDEAFEDEGREPVHGESVGEGGAVRSSELASGGLSSGFSDEFGATQDFFTLEPKSATSATAEVDEPGGITVLGFALSAGASVTLETHTYLDNDPARVGENRVRARTGLDAAVRLKAANDYSELEARLLLRRDLADEARNRLEPEELFANIHLANLDLLAGRTHVTWGRANLFSPADFFAPADFRDFVAREKKPLYLARLGATFGPVRLEGYYLPFFTADDVDIPLGVAADGRIQSPSRWITGSLPTASSQGTPIAYTFAQPQNDPWSTATPQFGARLAVTAGDLDASIAYAWLVDPYPSFHSTITTTDHIAITTETSYLRRHALAADVEWAIKKLRFAGEALVVIPDARADDTNAGSLPYFTAVAGVDYRTPQFFDDHDIQLFLDLTVTRTLVGDIPADQDDPNYAVARARFPMPAAALARAVYNWGPDFSFGVTAISNFGQFIFSNPLKRDPHGDFYVRPEAQLVLFDRVKAIAGADFMLGGKDEFFGSFHQNSRFTASVAATY